MKKALLLSVVASGVIFAGGDIAPVEPVQPVVKPQSAKFWGYIAARYDAVKDAALANSWGKADNFFAVAGALGVEKDLAYGFGIGAEVGGFTHAGLTNIAANTINAMELSQLYLTYKVGNTAIKAGRQALPASLSPWASSDRTAGVLDRAYNGIVVVNTDLPNTTLVGAWVASFTDGTIGLPGTVKLDASGSDKGLFAAAIQYKGFENTTLTATAYYVPNLIPIYGAGGKAYSAWASLESKISDLNVGLQVGYAKENGASKSITASAYVGTTLGDLDAKLTVGYINNGGSTLNLSQAATANSNVDSGIWAAFADDTYAFGGDISGAAQKIAKLDLGYKLPYGKLTASVAYDKDSVNRIGATVGYEFNVAGVDSLISYTYVKNPTTGGSKVQRVRVQGVYKF